MRWGRRSWALARFLARTAGRAAAVRALPAYLVTGIAVVVLFGGNGMDARTMTELASRSRGAHAGLLLAWLSLTLPAARAWLMNSETTLVRARPLPPGVLYAALGLGSALIHAPWVVLWSRGSGLLAGAFAFGAACSLQLAWLAGLRRVADLGWLLASLGVAFGTAPGALGLALLGLSSARGLREVWRRAPEPPAEGRHWVLSRPASLAVASALAISTLRGHRPVFVRAIGLALASAFAIGVQEQRGPSQLAESVGFFWGPACIAGALGIAGPLSRVEQKFCWLVRARGEAVRAGWAPWLVLGAWGALLGAALAWGVALALDLELAALAAFLFRCGLLGAAWSVMALGVARCAERAGVVDPTRLLLGGLGLALVSFGLTAWSAQAALPILLVLGALVLRWGRRVVRQPSR